MEDVRGLWPTERSGLPRCSYYELWWRFLRLSSRLFLIFPVGWWLTSRHLLHLTSGPLNV